MAMLTANGLGVVTADFVLPISRAWHVDMTVATADVSKLNGAVTLSVNDGALTMKGTAAVEDVYLDTVRARVVAGAGGLGKAAKPKFYQQTTVRIVLMDLLGAAGEALSSTADAGVLATQLAAWTVLRMPVADAVGLLMDEVGANWRMLADGTLWCGAESWPDSGLTFSLEQADRAHGQLVVALEAPLLMPGVSLGGDHVSYVETHVDARTVRSTVWLATASSADRLRDPMVAMTRSALPHIDYLAPYRCRVVSQSGQALDLVPDDARLPAAGFKAVPIRHGLPGVQVQVAPGAFVLLGFMGGDPSKPFCGLWEGGETFTAISIGSSADNVMTKADFISFLQAWGAAAVGTTDGGALMRTNTLSALTGAGWTVAGTIGPMGSQTVKVQR